MRQLYPPIKPYEQGKLKVSYLHTIYYEQSGNSAGKPLLFLHGGPGGGTRTWYRQYFDPQKWRIILFDQRGCGKSTPLAELRENNTWNLINDIEKLRKYLNIEEWVIFGGSWGSTLALAYSQCYPDYCKGLILCGIFMSRPSEINWLYQEGASYIYPDTWQKYLEFIPLAERNNLLLAFYKRLTSSSKMIRINAARRWTIWENSICKLIISNNHSQGSSFHGGVRVTSKINQRSPAARSLLNGGNPHNATSQEGTFVSRRCTSNKLSVSNSLAEALARIECHYFVNKGFLKTENQLIDNLDRIRHLPGIIIQGRYDLVCPMITAWELHKAWQEAEFIIVPDAGHAISEPGMINAIIKASDRFATL
jgi:proline iminopeptidase